MLTQLLNFTQLVLYFIYGSKINFRCSYNVWVAGQGISSTEPQGLTKIGSPTTGAGPCMCSLGRCGNWTMKSGIFLVYLMLSVVTG